MDCKGVHWIDDSGYGIAASFCGSGNELQGFTERGNLNS
jgi:hypothetical protein